MNKFNLDVITKMDYTQQWTFNIINREVFHKNVGFRYNNSKTVELNSFTTGTI